MAVIVSIKEKRREKQRLFEMKLLRELSLQKIVEKAEGYFVSFFQQNPYYKTSMEDVCVDTAIESYLLGADYSKFGFYGEPFESVQNRANQDINEMIHYLYDHFLYYKAVDENEMMVESLYRACEHYIDFWWKHGFDVGKRRRRMRLH